jgi:hypothetical protein
MIVRCEFCDNTSCNCGGCNKCDEKFGIAIALSWAMGGSLGDESKASLPEWYKTIHEELEKQYDYESCHLCCFKRLDFAKTMITDRIWAEKHINEFTCTDHGNALVQRFHSEILVSEGKKSPFEVEGKND